MQSAVKHDNGLLFLLPLMSDTSLLFSLADGVATLTLNRPDVFNSINKPLARWPFSSGCASARPMPPCGPWCSRALAGPFVQGRT
jgi:hypothetical protein